MAANEEFPRGFSAGQRPGTGVGASITIPASAGVALVLDGFEASFTNNGAAAGSSVDVLLNSNLGTFASFSLGFMGADGTLGAQGACSGSGLGLTTQPGESLTVLIGGVPGFLEQLLIQGHAI